jgi:hypothetical protein
MVKALDRWLLPVLRSRLAPRAKTPAFVFVALCDHFEPLHDTDHAGALARLDEWIARYPDQLSGIRDCTGRGWKHTFFYPIEQNHPEILSRLHTLVSAVHGEVEVHLHHDRDTEENLTRTLHRGIGEFREHGFLGTDRSGAVRYGFIHGNWALDDSGLGGRNCGVPNELGVLRRTGCYADFTMPSAPHPTQVATVNSIYYAKDTPERCSHNKGIPARTGAASSLRDKLDHLLCIQGPLLLNWRRRKFGVLPRIENSDITAVNPPTELRFRLWCEAAVHVQGRPDWIFVKLHTHSALPSHSRMFFGPQFRQFLEYLSALSHDESSPFRPVFVSAREMANLVAAAEDGQTGGLAELRDYLVLPPACLQPSVH